MMKRAPRQRAQPKPIAIMGLPRFNYHVPVVATLLAAIFIAFVLGLLTLVSLRATMSRLRVAEGQSVDAVSVGICGLVTLLFLLGTLFFITAVYKGVKDLLAPPYYARGTVSEKRSAGGRKAGNWLTMSPRYLGSDLSVASQVTDDQRAASPDRSQVFQPRFSPGGAEGTKGGGYLPATRISSAIPGLDDSRPSIVFRIDPASYAILETGEEVLIAHSRYLQHVFYVAHLKGGEWESYRNKQLI